ncbi:MAG: PAS domain-containing sensor histidine kinase, partial [bacterium]
MKVFSKQLIVLFAFFALFFGFSIYFSYAGITTSLDILARQNASLLALRVRSIVENGLSNIDLTAKWSRANTNKIRPYLLNELQTYHEISEFILHDEVQSQSVFSLYSSPPPEFQLPAPAKEGSNGAVAVQKPKASANFIASWYLPKSKTLRCVLIVNPKTAVSDVLHNLTLQFYIIGFSGILGVIILSMVWSRVLNAPLKDIEKAMTNIDKRKYGFRLKTKKESQFKPVYEKVNTALQRLEQLDSVQRNAVQQKNALLKEMKTISRFMDMMAHEVKNPLHALVINVDVLKTKIEKGKGKPDILKHSAILEQELDHLQEVIQGFLSYVRPGVPRRERTQINEILKDVCQMVAPEAEKSGIRVETRLARKLNQVIIDRGQFQQAMHNLLINAVHATPSGGKVHVRSLAKRKKVVVSIKDTGTGIEKKQMQQIFDLYFSTNKNGTGLGLPISKRIIEANGGEMYLDSKVNKGT